MSDRYWCPICKTVLHRSMVRHSEHRVFVQNGPDQLHAVLSYPDAPQAPTLTAEVKA